ncbi:hypothetical protein M404DRAFT_166472, partial [Pisolithus tinctorius Marx 270]
YGSSSIHSVVTFSNLLRSINVIVSTTAAAVSPIFKFHSTAVMNFISADYIFCAYLMLTLDLMLMVNAGPLYFEPFRFKTMCALEKYVAQSFLLVACHELHGRSGVCRLMARSITDRHALWVNISNLHCMSVLPAGVFDSLGFMDLIWLLGGYVCRSVYPFICAQSFLIKDDS